MRRRLVAMTLATAFVLTQGLPAAAKPPKGACQNPSAPGETIAALPWAQQLFDPARTWRHSTGAGVLVAVIDSGVDTDHPQLRRTGKVLPGRDFFLVGKLAATFDCVSHGTAVASVIAADPVRGIGFQGLAPGARILPVRVIDRDVDGAGDTRVIDPIVLAKGIRYAVDQGAKVINLSMSGRSDDAEVRTAIAYARSKDVLLVAAAGNGQRDGEPIPSYPAAYDGVLGVGAIDLTGARLGNSQIGPYVDLVAPGGGVLGATRIRGHTYWQGTSFAAPFVAATAALVRAAWPRLSAAQVVQRLLATATPARGGTNEYGAGIVDPFRAVTEGLSAAKPTPAPPMPKPVPDTEALAQTAWWTSTGLHARELAATIIIGTLLVALFASIVAAGRRRRWVVAPSNIPQAPDDPEPPENLFATNK